MNELEFDDVIVGGGSAGIMTRFVFGKMPVSRQGRA
jgi:hypothetical protein